MRARMVLDDCRTVLEWLDSAADERSFRIYWVALVALLRAVGHVLEALLIAGCVPPGWIAAT